VKALLLAIVCVSFAAGSAWGQAGHIGIYRDTAGMSCNLDDKTPGLTPYYIVHAMTGGATACQYSAPKPACLQAMYLSDTNVFGVTVGSSQTGVSIGYGNCRIGSIHVQTMNFFTQGSTLPCCEYWTCPDPLAGSGEILVVDCNMNLISASGMRSIVNATFACNCDMMCLSMDCIEALYRTSSTCFGVPIEDATWGRVKDAYSE